MYAECAWRCARQRCTYTAHIVYNHAYEVPQMYVTAINDGLCTQNNSTTSPPSHRQQSIAVGGVVGACASDNIAFGVVGEGSLVVDHAVASSSPRHNMVHCASVQDIGCNAPNNVSA